MKLRKCVSCKTYTMKEKCPKCNGETIDGHYKYIVREGTGRFIL